MSSRPNRSLSVQRSRSNGARRPVRRSRKPAARPQQRNQQPSNRPAPKPAAVPKPKPVLSGCAAKYAATLIDPYTHHGIGVPTVPAVPSWKTYVFARGTLQTSSTTGIGYVLASPLNAIVNDATAVYYTGSNYAGTTMATTGTGVVTGLTNSPYAAAALGGQESGVTYRVVSAGLRVRYRGTNLDMGGTLYSVTHPTHAALDNANAGDLAAINLTKIGTVSREWTSTVWCPVYPQEFNFNSSVGGTTPMAHLIVAPDATQTISFDWELTVNVEFVGMPVRGMTVGQSDNQGFGAVTSAMQGQPIVHRGESAGTVKSFLSRVEDILVRDTSRVVDWAGNKAIEFLGTAAESLMAL